MKSLIFLSFCLFSAPALVFSQQTGSSNFSSTYKHTKKAKFIKKQRRLESQVSWEKIKRERDTKRLKYEEKKTIRTLDWLSSDSDRDAHFVLENNKQYTVPEDRSYYIMNNGLKENDRIVFYKNKEGDILKVADAISENAVVVIFPENPTDRKILIQDYIKADPGSIISLMKNTDEKLEVISVIK